MSKSGKKGIASRRRDDVRRVDRLSDVERDAAANRHTKVLFDDGCRSFWKKRGIDEPNEVDFYRDFANHQE